MGAKTKEQLAYTKEWKKANPEKVKATKKKSYERNKEKWKAASLKQYHLNKLNPEWVEKEKERKKKYRYNRSITRRQWIQDVRQGLFCLHCGMNKAECLDFHHRDPNEKERTVAYAFRKWGKVRTLREISKCDVLCSNCHRTYHWEERNAGLVSV
jgi:hypothetical protein